MAAGFDILEHTADIGFRAWGASAAEVLQQASRALIFIAFDVSSVSRRQARTIEAHGTDWADVLVNFLGEVLYLFDAGHFATADCRVDHACPTGARVTLIGEPRDPARHPWKLIVKAVTYHDLAMEARKDGWHARVILDV